MVGSGQNGMRGHFGGRREMNGGTTERQVRFSLLGVLLIGLAELGGGIFLPQALLLQRELSLSYTQVIWLLFAEICGVALGFLRSAGAGTCTRAALAWGLSHFFFGNLLIGLSRELVGLLLGGFFVGLGCFQIKRSVLAEVVGKAPSSAISMLAVCRLTIVLTSVSAPLFGALFLQTRGVREGAYLLSFFAALLFLFSVFILPKSRKTHPVLGDISPKPPAIEGALTPFSLCFFLFGGVLELFRTATGVFLFAISGNLFLSALVLSLLKIGFGLCKVAIIA